MKRIFNKLNIAPIVTHVVTLTTIILIACVGQAQKTAPSKLPTVKVYRSPTCGCCGKWVDHMKEAGFKVEVEMVENVSEKRNEFKIPGRVGSCHTAKVGDYYVEGHVPASDVKKMLEQDKKRKKGEKPKFLGIAVPGMPIGSPGMEQGDRKDPYHVYKFTKDAEVEIFSSHNQPTSLKEK